MSDLRGSVTFPAANVERVMALASNLTRMAALLEANAEAHRNRVNSVLTQDRWSGAASEAFSGSSARRADQATRAATALRAVSQTLTSHGNVISQTTHGYAVAAEGEQYLRQHYPHAQDAINSTIVSQAQHSAALLQSAAGTVPVITEAMNEFSQMTVRARVDSARPAVQRAQQFEDFFDFASDLTVPGRGITLDRIERGTLTPDPQTRLGAYAATVSYPPGSVGYAVHRAIGSIYLTMGTVGEERIGTVFNSAEARALFDKPLTERTSRQIAELEHRYWDSIRRQNPMSVGGQLGSLFGPDSRDFLQRHVFGSSPQPIPPARTVR
jgi:uncharacterized protein YukE